MMPTKTQHIPPMSTTPDGFSIERDLPTRFAAFYSRYTMRSPRASSKSSRTARRR